MTDCPTVNKYELVRYSQEQYSERPYSDFMHQFFRQAAAGYEIIDNKPYSIKTRLEVIIDFCQPMKYKKFGLAFCTPLEDCAKVLAKDLREEGFKVVSAV